MDFQFETQNGSISFKEMTQGQPTLVAFVRHLG